ncbi:hypothetical protein ACDX78_00070 [Virgibacillus oceani]
MSIYQISGERLTHLNNQMSRLKPGQIMQGKIIKIFPDNKAQITLGSTSMIAQLEASLTIGARYHFQVKSTDRLLHLQVLGERLKNGNEMNAKTLLQQLGFSESKSNILLIKGLLDKSIPLEKTDIANALQLLNDSKNKKATMPLLQQMIVHKLPVTPSVLQAIHSIQTSNLTQQIQSMLAAAEKGSDNTKLIRLLEGLNTRPAAQNELMTAEIMKQAKNNNQQLFSLLQFSGAISQNLDFSTWKSTWNKHASGSTQQPFSIKLPSALQGMEQITQQKNETSAFARETMQLWGNKLSEAITKHTGLAEREFKNIKQQLTPFYSLLNTAQQSFLKNLNNNSADLERLFNVLTMLSSNSSYTNADRLLNQINAGNNILQASSKEQFLMHLKQWLTTSGMDYENQLVHNRLQPEASLKGMLLQLLASGNGRAQEQAGQFVQYMNGLQLNSLHETNGFLHISMQIPGEKLGLLKDISLEFESRKTDSGEINPEHCRILFYLHLENLHETVVDMNIQKRAVTVTVYNNTENPGDLFDGLKNKLKKGLEDLNYQLSNVQYRELQKLESPVENKNITQHISQGVDYRI